MLKPSPATAGLALINAKERDETKGKGRRAKKRKGSQVQRAKPPTLIRVNDTLTGDEEQNGKRNK